MEILHSHRDGTALGRIPVGAEGWTTPARGIRVSGDRALTHALTTRALIEAAGRPAFACDLTAAHLWSMVVPSGFGLEVDAQACAVATVRNGNRLQSRGTRGRRLELPDDHVTLLDGIPITTPARTWVDCAALVRWADVVAMGDALCRAGLASAQDLAAMTVWAKGRRGVRLARKALEILDPRAESPAESWVRAFLHIAGIPMPECNPTVTIGGNRFRLDMAWLRERVALEYDGVDFHGPDRHAYDQWRRRLLRDAGWIIIVVTKEDLSDFGRVVEKLDWLLRQRAA